MPVINSVETAAPLGSGGSWESDWIRRLGWQVSVNGSVFADKAGTLHIEQSSNGEDADVDTEYAIDASDGKGFTEPLVATFWRLRYVNGGVAQGAFRLSGSARRG